MPEYLAYLLGFAAMFLLVWLYERADVNRREG